MKVNLLAKKNKPYVDKVIDYTNEKFQKCSVYLGEVGNEFPTSIQDGCDVLISYLSPWVLPGAVLSKTRLWNINFHPGPPEYPGIGCTNFAIFNKEITYGVTAHIMEEKVDSGKIIGIKRFDIKDDDTVLSLTNRCYEKMFLLFQEVVEFILVNNDIPNNDEYWTREPYTRKQLNNLCRIESTMSEEEIMRRVKATTYPGKPGAYIEINGEKVPYENCVHRNS